MKAFLLFLVFSLHTSVQDPPTWLNDLQSASKKAQAEQKFILLNFSGSDWCIPCIRMHKDIFGTELFQEMARRKLVLVNADFPRQKKNQLSKEQQALNEAMADKYNPDGKFPMTVLLDGQGHVVRSWEGYYDDGAAAFTRLLDNLTNPQ